MKNKKFSVPKFNLDTARRLLFLSLVAFLSFTLGYLANERGFLIPTGRQKVTINRNLPAGKEDLSFDLFWKVWNIVETSYYDKSQLDPAKMVYGAIKGMVASVGDPYTIFLTPEENHVTEEDLSGNFEGVGIQIGFRGTQLAVIAPLPNSPAEEAGIRPGDIIAGIKDTTKDIERGTAGITLPEAVQIIRGPAGSKITLSILRDGVENPILIDVTRKTIDVPSVVTTMVGENDSIAHIRVLKFGGETTQEWNDAVVEVLKNENLKGIVLDLRNNPGGYLQGAIDLGSEFLKKGETVVIEETGAGERYEFPVETIGRFLDDKVVVLVNGGSASASEILAGALRDNLHTPLIGETTFGKGTIQEPKQLDNGVGLHITISRWLTPSGFWVNGKGLTPDVELEDNPETREDEQLNEAIKYLSGNSQTANL